MINLQELYEKITAFLVAFRSDNTFNSDLFDEIYADLKGVIEKWKAQESIPKLGFLCFANLIEFLARGSRFLSHDDCVKVENASISISELYIQLEE